MQGSSRDFIIWPRARPARNKTGDSGGIAKGPMATRSAKSKKPLSEEELEITGEEQTAEDKRLREMASNLAAERERTNQESAELAKERERFNRERAESENNMETAFRSMRECSNLFINMRDDLMREMNLLHRDVDILWREPSGTPSPPPGQRFLGSPSPPPASNDINNVNDDPQFVPKISLREAIDVVPRFDGYNISLSQFTKACRRARDIVPARHERQLTKLLISRLSQRAYSAVEDEPCDTVTQLLDLLNGAFGSANTIAQYRGELNNIYVSNNEHILDSAE